ncbi:MAG: DUF5700 domain-containing putative Zn-dependent protease [Planctomycetota bacterium]|jgi:hypothetical protein
MRPIPTQARQLGLAAFLLAACTSTQSRPLVAEDLLNGSAVEKFWVIQDLLAADAPVSEEAWDAMFATPGYQWQAPDTATRQRIRDRMEIAFDPDRSRIETAIAESEGFATIRWQHFARIRDERAALGRYYGMLREMELMADALALAQEHLPPGIVFEEPWKTPVHLLFFGPDAFAGDGAVYLDLLQAMDREEQLVLLLAHEFHHEFYAALSPLPQVEKDSDPYWIVHALRQLHQEGIADLIDKGPFPLTGLKGLPPEYMANFNRHYREAPQTLERFDELLRDYARAEVDRAELAGEAWGLMHYGAHPEGYYMANTIRKAQGSAALIEDVGDPFAFFRRFQTVEPLFSEETMVYLTELEAELLASSRQ